MLHVAVPRRLLILVCCLLGLALATGCATTPTGRQQLQFISPAKMSQLGNEAYVRIKEETPVAKDQRVQEYVGCICQAVTNALPPPYDAESWEVTVFDKDKEVNAFALPGGNIGVYTGLLEVTENQDQLAAVISHEVAHVIAEHGNARVSTNYATSLGLNLLDAFIGGSSAQSEQIMSLLGLGAQVGILLPYSRAQESEADILGLTYMAEAGFDPRASVALWENMAKAGGSAPPEFLSTHPSGETRIQTLQRDMPEALRLYERAKARGSRPDCRPPARN